MCSGGVFLNNKLSNQDITRIATSTLLMKSCIA
jgi:hypothetical protein